MKLLLALLLLPSAALADSNSLVTLGLGAAVGMRQTTLGDGTADRAIEPQLNLRLRLFRVLGAELEVVPRFGGQVQESNSVGVRASGLLYLIPLDAFGLYVKAGVGHGDVGQLFADLGSWQSLHFGGGVELYVGEHFAVGAELIDELPIDELVERIADDRIFELDNFRAGLAIRYFL